MNAWIRRLSIEEIDNMPPDDIASLIDKLPGDNGDSNLKRTHWISEYEIKMDVANYTKAPDFVVAAVDDALSICRAGRQKYIDLVAYLREVEKGHRAALLSAAQESSYDDYTNKWDAVEARHVQVTSGFIYLLSHELMPGIYKIGFTSRNPDTRAASFRKCTSFPQVLLLPNTGGLLIPTSLSNVFIRSWMRIANQGNSSKETANNFLQLLKNT